MKDLEFRIAVAIEVAKSPSLWKATYGKKSLAEVMSSEGVDCETLCRMGVSTDEAVRLSVEKNGHAIKRTIFITKKSAKGYKGAEKPVQKQPPKVVVVRKKSGEVKTLYRSGNRYVCDLKGRYV